MNYAIEISDPNLSGVILADAATRSEISAIVRDAGSWRNYGDGDVLLAEPTVYVYTGQTADDIREYREMTGDPYPDFCVETGPRGGVSWIRS